jgi:DNA-binding NtrC family response regulator
MEPDPILVVDDDEDVRNYAVAVLQSAGYGVFTACDAVEAFILLEENPHIRLMFTDVVMPRIDGLMLADMAKLRNPDLRVLYATGYEDRVTSQPGYRYGALLTKPYRAGQLEAAIRRTLDEPPSARLPARA